MPVWQVALVLNLALAIGLGLGYAGWGRRLDALDREFDAARAQVERLERERAACAAGGRAGEQQWDGRGIVRAAYPRLVVDHSRGDRRAAAGENHGLSRPRRRPCSPTPRGRRHSLLVCAARSPTMSCWWPSSHGDGAPTAHRCGSDEWLHGNNSCSANVSLRIPIRRGFACVPWPMTLSRIWPSRPSLPAGEE